MEIEDRGQPRLRINQRYVQLFRDGRSDPDGRDFVRGYLERARMLLSALVHRERTIVRVVRAIAELQQAFLEHGVSRLQPLVLRDVARRVGLSVATAGKYVATPRGVYPLKAFFSASLVAEGGDLVSSASLRQRLREAIEAEDRTQPLSDAQIAAQLRSGGVRVSRRWVTKHREAMRIPSSYGRAAHRAR